MTGSKAAFARAIDSQFERLGQEAVYVDLTGQSYPIRVIAHLPEQLLELGEQKMHAKKAQLMFRVDDVHVPKTGDKIHIDGWVYRVEAEPRLDAYRWVWFVDCSQQ